MNADQVAQLYIDRQLKRVAFHATEADCCSIVQSSRLEMHQRGLYHHALCYSLNLAALQRAVNTLLEKRWAVQSAEKLLSHSIRQ